MCYLSKNVYFCIMKQQQEVTFQSLTANEDVQIGYSDNDIVVVDSIQQFTEVRAAHVAMNAIAICTQGKIRAQMSGSTIQLVKNQIAIVPQNVMVTDVMVSPDFDMKAMFFTTHILQSFLREKMNVWNGLMYIQRKHILTMDDVEFQFYTKFYDMLTLVIESGKDKPFCTEIIQSLLRGAVLGLCSSLTVKLHNPVTPSDRQSASNTHFQRFINLLNDAPVKHRTVEDYASELCISPKYLSMQCKKCSGKTASEWITEHVLEEIRFCLKQTDLSIKQICDRLGFPNTSFFGRYVKQHFGMPPIEYRNKG